MRHEIEYSDPRRLRPTLHQLTREGMLQRRPGSPLLGFLRFRRKRDPGDEAAGTIQDLRSQIISLEQSLAVLKQTNESLVQRVIQVSARAERAECEKQSIQEKLSRMEPENERMRAKADEIERIVDDTRATFEQLEHYK